MHSTRGQGFGLCSRFSSSGRRCATLCTHGFRSAGVCSVPPVGRHADHSDCMHLRPLDRLCSVQDDGAIGRVHRSAESALCCAVCSSALAFPLCVALVAPDVGSRGQSGSGLWKRRAEQQRQRASWCSHRCPFSFRHPQTSHPLSHRRWVEPVAAAAAALQQRAQPLWPSQQRDPVVKQHRRSGPRRDLALTLAIAVALDRDRAVDPTRVRDRDHAADHRRAGMRLLVPHVVMTRDPLPASNHLALVLARALVRRCDATDRDLRRRPRANLRRQQQHLQQRSDRDRGRLFRAKPRPLLVARPNRALALALPARVRDRDRAATAAVVLDRTVALVVALFRAAALARDRSRRPRADLLRAAATNRKPAVPRQR